MKWYQDFIDSSYKAQAQDRTSSDIDWETVGLATLLGGLGIGGAVAIPSMLGGLTTGVGRSLPWLGSYYATFGQSYGAGQALSREWLASADRDWETM